MWQGPGCRGLQRGDLGEQSPAAAQSQLWLRFSENRTLHISWTPTGGALQSAMPPYQALLLSLGHSWWPDNNSYMATASERWTSLSMFPQLQEKMIAKYHLNGLHLGVGPIAGNAKLLAISLLFREFEQKSIYHFVEQHR